jgi:penicillin V acylase-like amidase (Ntn superfamily)
MKSPTTTTLTADGATPWHTVQGTLVQLQVSGNFGSGSVAIQIKSTAGTAIPLADDANQAIALTIAQAKNIEVPAGTEVRASLSGSTSPALIVSIAEVSDLRQP